jgi:hypothetical protein
MRPAVRARRGFPGEDTRFDGGPGHTVNRATFAAFPPGAQYAWAGEWRDGPGRGTGPAAYPGRGGQMPEPPISAHAGAELADRLREAWVQAGKPHMAAMGDEVGYSQATISKVLAGRMPPAWHLVRKLGVLLDVPSAVIVEQWHPLWVAADNFRRAIPDAGPEWAAANDFRRAAPDAGPEWAAADDFGRAARDDFGRATADAGPERPEEPAGRVCDRCGSWVIDLSRHTEWHLQLEDRAIVRPTDSLEWGHLRDAVSRRKDD